MPHNGAMSSSPSPRVAVIGGGPAGLFAAETLRAAGVDVDVYEANGSVGRRLLIAGKGGLNLTHSDPFDLFVSRYGARADWVADWLRDFDAQALRDWAAGLGVPTFVGSSGRVFPVDLKAAPLLRGWVRRLREAGVRFHVQHRWTGWDDAGQLQFETPDGPVHAAPAATVLALGGGSWPELGGNTRWVAPLQTRGVEVAPLRPANCGFDIGWSAFLAERFAGTPLKPVIAHWTDENGQPRQLQGECVITAHGIEGSLIYALSARLRDAIERNGSTTLLLDLAPGRDLQRLQRELAKPRGSRSLGEHLRRQTGLDGVRVALLHEVLDKAALGDTARVAQTIKALPLRLIATRPIEEAISSAGGIRAEALDVQLMLRALPGVFAAGEMLDWEAPTGGYLLTASYASGLRAARGVLAWLATQSR